MEDKSCVGLDFGITLMSFSWLEMTFVVAIGHWTIVTPWVASARNASLPLTLSLQDLFLVVRFLEWSSK